eukprot:6047657-Amphidinium_carterae.1
MLAVTQGTVKQAEDGSKPLDDAMRRLMFDYQVALHLQFLAESPSGASGVRRKGPQDSLRLKLHSSTSRMCEENG